MSKIQREKQISEDMDASCNNAEVQKWIEHPPREIHEPIVEFLKKYPQYITKAHSPQEWEKVAELWAPYARLVYVVKIHKMSPFKLVKMMVGEASNVLGTDKVMMRRLKWFLLLHKGYYDLKERERPFGYDVIDNIPVE